MTHSNGWRDPRALYPIVNDTPSQSWCGPSVLCAITNQPMSVIRRLVKDRRESRGSKQPLMGMTDGEVVAILRMFGFRVHEQRNYCRSEAPTLAKWLRGREHRSATYILTTSYRGWHRGHFVVVRGNKFADSHQLEPCNLSKAPHRRKRVKQVIRVYQTTKRRITAPPIHFKL